MIQLFKKMPLHREWFQPREKINFNNKNKKQIKKIQGSVDQINQNNIKNKSLLIILKKVNRNQKFHIL